MKRKKTSINMRWVVPPFLYWVFMPEQDESRFADGFRAG